MTNVISDGIEQIEMSKKLNQQQGLMSSKMVVKSQMCLMKPDAGVLMHLLVRYVGTNALVVAARVG